MRIMSLRRVALLMAQAALISRGWCHRRFLADLQPFNLDAAGDGKLKDVSRTVLITELKIGNASLGDHAPGLQLFLGEGCDLVTHTPQVFPEVNDMKIHQYEYRDKPRLHEAEGARLEFSENRFLSEVHPKRNLPI